MHSTLPHTHLGTICQNSSKTSRNRKPLMVTIVTIARLQSARHLDALPVCRHGLNSSTARQKRRLRLQPLLRYTILVVVFQGSGWGTRCGLPNVGSSRVVFKVSMTTNNVETESVQSLNVQFCFLNVVLITLTLVIPHVIPSRLGDAFPFEAVCMGGCTTAQGPRPCGLSIPSRHDGCGAIG